MESSVPLAYAPIPPASALIVDPVLSDALFLVSVVSALGFRVTVADTFADALERLRAHPALLIAAIRLAEYNGLHLVLRGKSARPALPALVTSTVPDPVLQLEAEQLGATFVLKPIGPEELRGAILRTIFQTAESGPIRPPFERRKGERRVSASPEYRPERRVRDRRKNGLWLVQGTIAM
jgi:CheY-like chemotaxis protein